MAAESAEYDERLALAAAELDRLTTRLRRLSPASWTARRVPVVTLLRRLAEVERSASGGEHHDVPTVPDHALGDAVATTGGDALDALADHPDDGRLAVVLSAVRTALDATR